jgi:hypothetical protein
VLFNRFFAAQSLARHDLWLMAAASFFLATKVEEQHRRTREVLAAVIRAKYRRPLALFAAADSLDSAAPVPFRRVREQMALGERRELAALDDPAGAAHIALRGRLLDAERRLMYTLGFDIAVEQPYPLITAALRRWRAAATASSSASSASSAAAAAGSAATAAGGGTVAVTPSASPFSPSPSSFATPAASPTVAPSGPPASASSSSSLGALGSNRMPELGVLDRAAQEIAYYCMTTDMPLAFAPAEIAAIAIYLAWQQMQVVTRPGAAANQGSGVRSGLGSGFGFGLGSSSLLSGLSGMGSNGVGSGSNGGPGSEGLQSGAALFERFNGHSHVTFAMLDELCPRAVLGCGALRYTEHLEADLEDEEAYREAVWEAWGDAFVPAAPAAFPSAATAAAVAATGAAVFSFDPAAASADRAAARSVSPTLPPAPSTAPRTHAGGAAAAATASVLVPSSGSSAASVLSMGLGRPGASAAPRSLSEFVASAAAAAGAAGGGAPAQ